MGKEHTTTRVEYNPEDRKRFLQGIMHAKEIRKKNATKKAEIALKEERRERHKIRKEKGDQFAQEIMARQRKLGISPLDILSQGPSAVIPKFEIEVEKPEEEEVNEAPVEKKEEKKIEEEPKKEEK